MSKLASELELSWVHDPANAAYEVWRHTAADFSPGDTAAELLQSAADRAGIALAKLDVAPPGVDFPRLRGFPEGDSFDAAIAELR